MSGILKLIDPRGTEVAQSPSESNRSIIRLPTSGLIIPATDGTENLFDPKVFSYIDPNLRRWGCGARSKASNKATFETTVDVCEIIEKDAFTKMCQRLEIRLDQLCLTPHQINVFVRLHWEHMNLDSDTFFPFQVGRKFFMARVHRVGGGDQRMLLEKPSLGVCVDGRKPPWCYGELREDVGMRVVLPRVGYRI